MKITNEVLDFSQKALAMLKKMGKNKANSFGGNQGASDMDKIFMQFFLDIEAWGVELEKFDINIHTFTPFIQLLTTVNKSE